MISNYLDNDFEEKDLSCSKYGWKGKGHEVVVIDFYGVTDKKEMHCPQCDTTIALLQKGEDQLGESATELSFQLG